MRVREQILKSKVLDGRELHKDLLLCSGHKEDLGVILKVTFIMHQNSERLKSSLSCA